MRDDCGDGSDENNSTICNDFIACSFEDIYDCYWDVHRPSSGKHLTKPLTNGLELDVEEPHVWNDDFPLRWGPWVGETPTPNTGPFHDHSFQDKDGKSHKGEYFGQ